jgi:hypothetical protein
MAQKARGKRLNPSFFLVWGGAAIVAASTVGWALGGVVLIVAGLVAAVFAD